LTEARTAKRISSSAKLLPAFPFVCSQNAGFPYRWKLNRLIEAVVLQKARDGGADPVADGILVAREVIELGIWVRFRRTNS
jgi:hypothetical protein